MGSVCEVPVDGPAATAILLFAGSPNQYAMQPSSKFQFAMTKTSSSYTISCYFDIQVKMECQQILDSRFETPSSDVQVSVARSAAARAKRHGNGLTVCRPIHAAGPATPRCARLFKFAQLAASHLSLHLRIPPIQCMQTGSICHSNRTSRRCFSK